MSFLKRLNIISQKKIEEQITWIGLDNSGKTTLIKRITQGKFDPNQKATLGMNIDEFNSENVSLTNWDISGQQVYRESLWESYISKSTGLIYVVDSSDTKRFEESRIELWKWVLGNENLEKIPLLILANKQDLPNARSTGEVARNLFLQKVKKNSFAILPCSALSGFKLDEAVEWLRQKIRDNGQEDVFFKETDSFLNQF